MPGVTGDSLSDFCSVVGGGVDGGLAVLLLSLEVSGSEVSILAPSEDEPLEETPFVEVPLSLASVGCVEAD